MVETSIGIVPGGVATSCDSEGRVAGRGLWGVVGGGGGGGGTSTRSGGGRGRSGPS